MKNSFKTICIVLVFVIFAAGSAVVPKEQPKESEKVRKPANTGFVEYSPDEYTTDICANCETYIDGKAYIPSEEFMQFISSDFDREDLAVCEDCAREIYREELDAGASLDNFLAK